METRKRFYEDCHLTEFSAQCWTATKQEKHNNSPQNPGNFPDFAGNLLWLRCADNGGVSIEPAAGFLTVGYSKMHSALPVVCLFHHVFMLQTCP